MNPRTVLLCIAAITLGVGAACSGRYVSLGGGHQEQVSAAGSTVIDTGGADAMTGSGAMSGLNVADADAPPLPCADGQRTSVTGTVYDPSSNVPLYNAVVYVPDGVPPPFQSTVTCETCTSSVRAFDVALTDSSGVFTLNDVPPGDTVNLVVQLGKWRSKAQTFEITPCGVNMIPDKMLHLPRNRSEGELPKIALSTGHSDALECLLRKIGISDSEFSTDAGDGAVSMFVGCAGDQTDKHTGAAKFNLANGGAAFPSTNQLFDTPGELSKYDVVIFSCEGHKCDAIQTPAHVDQLVSYANSGGRVYLDHDHYNWLNHAGDRTGDRIEAAAQFSSSPDDVPSPLTGSINAVPGFYKGQAFAQWLVNVGASSKLGELDLFSSKTSVESIDPNRAQSWIYRDPAGPYPDFFYLTIGTPVAVKDGDPAPPACGRVVFTDLHVSKSGGGCTAATSSCGESDDISDQDTAFPDGCTSVGLLPQEKALEFMIFDLSSCVQKETEMPVPPSIVK